jgi:hypothetical protein
MLLLRFRNTPQVLSCKSATDACVRIAATATSVAPALTAKVLFAVTLLESFRSAPHARVCST